MNGSHVGRRRLGSLLSAGILLFSLLGCQTPLQERRWLIVETENFQFITDYDDMAAIDRANEFETFHNFIRTLANLDAFESPVPTRVYLFSGSTSYRAFGPGIKQGYFNGTPRANYVSTSHVRGVPDNAIAFEGYGHFIIRSGRRLFGYPAWFDAGHAALVSTTQIKDGQVAFGAPLQQRIDVLERGGGMSLRRVLTAKNVNGLRPEDAFSFSATSWAFVHYLYFSEDSHKEKLWQKKDVYLQLMNEGVSEQDAFERAFGKTVSQVETHIYNHIRGELTTYTFPAEQFAPRQPPRLRVASAAEAAESLAELALELRDLPKAVQLLESTRAVETGRARALGMLGLVRSRQGRPNEAEPLLTRALQLAPESADAHYAYGMHLAGQAFAANVVPPTQLSDDQRRTYLERARAELLRAVEIAPSRPELYVELAYTYLYPGEPVDKGIAYADKAFELHPSDPFIVSRLAELLIMAKRGQEALPLLRRLRPGVRSLRYAAYIDALIQKAEAQVPGQ